MGMYPESPLFLPAGKKAGCLYRTTGYGKVFAPMAERVKIATRAEIRERINPALSNRRYIPHIFDQNGDNSCAAEETALAIATTQVRQGGPFVLLNPLSMYAFTSGGRNAGSSILDNWAFARDRGCLPEAVWPRSKGWNAKAPQELWDRFGVHFRLGEVYDAGSALEVATALTEQCVVGFGYDIGRDGHSCLLDHLLDEDTAEFANSWDETWDDEGFGRIKLRSINFGYGALAARTATICPGHILEEIAAYANAG